MKDSFVKLQQLQGVFTRKYEIEDKIRLVPKDLEEKKAALEATNRRYLELCNRENQLKQQMEDLKLQNADAEARREELEKSVEKLSLSREYDTVKKEIELAKAEEQRTRNFLIDRQKKIEELQSDIAEKEEVRRRQTEEVNSETAKIDEIISALEKDLNAVNAEISGLSEGIPESLLFKFARIIRNKDNLGIVAIHGTVCEGCHMTLPLQFVNNVRSEDDVYFCPYCSRVLFYEEVAGAEKQTFEPKQHDDEPSAPSEYSIASEGEFGDDF